MPVCSCSSSGSVQQAALQLKQPIYDAKSAAEKQQLHQQTGMAEVQFRQHNGWNGNSLWR